MNVMKGTTVECLRHYGTMLPADKMKPREPLADYCGVAPHAVWTWLTGRIEPQGESLLRARHFLEEQGYHVTELERLKVEMPVSYELSRLVAHNVISVEEVVKRVGFTCRSWFYRTVFYRGKPLPERLRRMEQIVKELASKDVGVKTVVPTVALEVKGEKREEAALRFSNGKAKVSEKQLTLDTLVGVLKVAMPLVERVLSDAFDGEDRGYVREQLGNNGVFKLSNGLNRLCGEKARTIIGNSKG